MLQRLAIDRPLVPPAPAERFYLLLCPVPEKADRNDPRTEQRVIMSSESELSVALQARDDHWTWRLVDLGGEIVASGAAAERAAAESQLWTAYRAENGASGRPRCSG
jgi:hypothetical protein